MIKGSQQMLKIGPSTSNFYVWASVLWRVIVLDFESVLFF